MDDEIIVIKNVRVVYITTKQDRYNNEQAYFKIKDKNIEPKFSPIIKDGFNLPWFKSDKGQYILKVKSKYVKLNEPKKDLPVIVDIDFKYYKMNDVEGHYVSSVV